MSKGSSDEHGPAHGGTKADANRVTPVVPSAGASLELEAESIGRYLSQQRRLRGISIEQLAESTRIPRRSLERLESGHFDDDVDGFVRGFVRTVAAGLGLDPEDALTRMLAEPRAHSDASRAMPAWIGRGLVLLVAALLVVMAFGVVRAVWQAGVHTENQATSEGLVWRSDPVRALAEAHRARVDPSDASAVARRTGASDPTPGREPAAE
jgi:cytoskeletal protein RodZ